ncbi:MAG: hypothetical protein R2764_11565 [Bacteroidales bacterium]
MKANQDKRDPLNSMAIISSRQINMEEARRYAGGFDDPAHLAASYAGVAENMNSNGIVIRGNAPKGLLWRMEGLEIANPSHFANMTSFGGGGITALSSQMVATSDFYTSAFPLNLKMRFQVYLISACDPVTATNVSMRSSRYHGN